MEFGLDKDTEEAEAEMQDAIAGLQPPAPVTGRRARGATPIRRGVIDPQPLLSRRGRGPRHTHHLRLGRGDTRLEEVEDVARVVLVGGADERIEVNLDPEELREYNLPAEADLCAASICCG